MTFPLLYSPVSPLIMSNSYIPGFSVLVNVIFIVPLLLFIPLCIVIPFAFIAIGVLFTNVFPVSSVIVAFIVVLLFLVVTLSGLMITAFVSSFIVPLACALW